MIVLTRSWVVRLVGFPDREHVGVDRRVRPRSLPGRLAVAVVGELRLRVLELYSCSKLR